MGVSCGHIEPHYVLRTLVRIASTIDSRKDYVRGVEETDFLSLQSKPDHKEAAGAR